jgi:hypothetical protein
LGTNKETESTWIVGLAIHCASAFEAAHKSFAAEKGTQPCGTGRFANVKVEASLKRHNVSCIYNVFTIHGYGIDSTKGREQNWTMPADGEPE